MTETYTAYTSFHQKHFQPVRNRLQGRTLRELKQTLHQEAPSVTSVAFAQKMGQISKPALKKATKYFLNSIIGLTIMIVMFVGIPYLYYAFAPADTEPVKTYESGTPIGGAFAEGPQASPVVQLPERQLPPQDPNLPEGQWVIIPKIGVRTELQATEDPDEALKTGVWMVPEYGRPGDLDKPVILAAHRFGWQWWWQTDYWKYHSFYLLPDLQPGDIVETIVDQRKYTYEIYAGEEGEEISDYQADMILYTCKHLNSPRRHFRYARLVDLNADTQAKPVSQVVQ